MQLTIGELKRLHEFWRLEIGKAEIWDASKFKPVEFAIRKACRSYHGMFQRKWKRGDKRRTLVDRIIIYGDAEKFESRFLNSVLVHEMIHQYVIQNNLQDTSTHGRLFKSLMNKINERYGEYLEIKISDKSPKTLPTGVGRKYYTLLILEEPETFFCGVVSQSKLQYFEKLIRTHSASMKLRNHCWAISNDIYFSYFRRSTRRLTGVRLPLADMEIFIKQHHIEIVKKLIIKNI